MGHLTSSQRPSTSLLQSWRSWRTPSWRTWPSWSSCSASGASSCLSSSRDGVRPCSHVLLLTGDCSGKIRNLIPYQPYQPACLEEISHQLERRQSDRKTKVTSLEVCGRCRSPPSTGHRDTSLADLVVQVRRDGNKSHSTAALSSQSANKVTPQSQVSSSKSLISSLRIFQDSSAHQIRRLHVFQNSRML